MKMSLDGMDSILIINPSYPAKNGDEHFETCYHITELNTGNGV